MEENLDLLDDGIVTSAYTGKRPVFLTVLCILTFVGVGGTIAFNWFSLFGINQLEKLSGTFSTDSAGPEVVKMYNWWKISILVNLFGGLTCLAAAIIMWNLRKFGYFIYIGGQIIPIGVSLVGANIGTFGGFGFISTFFWMIFPIGFSIMYGLNYKYMR